MAHSVSILFFTGLLIALAFLLDLMIQANRAEILAALRGVPGAAPDPRARLRPAAAVMVPPRMSSHRSRAAA